MVVVNCDQDHRPDLNPGAVMKKAEPDTPTITTNPTATMLTTSDTPNEANAAVDAAISEVWYLKPITFAGRRIRIITQNFNGSVSTGYRTTAVSTHCTEHTTSRPQAMLVYSDM